jgi:hypothetical protein
LEEEKATLEEMVESHDEDEDEEEEDADDGGGATSPPAVVPEEINKEGPMEVILEQEAPMPHEVVLADAELEVPQLHHYHALMRDYEENLLRPEDDFDDLDDDLNEVALTWTSRFLKMEVVIGIESLSLSLKFGSKIKFLGFA